jgi:hypothetical protein
MINKKLFFDEYRKHLDKNLSQKEVDAIDRFLDLTNKSYSTFKTVEWAYIFATVYHETNTTFLPVIEAYWKSDDWRRRNLTRYYPYFGRGFVQLTWLYNYRKFTKLLGIPLDKNPELACDFDTAFKILLIGCKDGIYTGKAIGDYVTDGKPNFIQMRRVINGNDKAELISDYAKEFQRILNISTK